MLNGGLYFQFSAGIADADKGLVLVGTHGAFLRWNRRREELGGEGCDARAVGFLRDRASEREEAA